MPPRRSSAADTAIPSPAPPSSGQKRPRAAAAATAAPAPAPASRFGSTLVLQPHQGYAVAHSRGPPPDAVRRLALVEALLWAGRANVDDADSDGDESAPPAAAAASTATATAAAPFPERAWHGVPSTSLPDFALACEFLRVHAAPLGLDARLASFREQASAALDAAATATATVRGELLRTRESEPLVLLRAALEAPLASPRALAAALSWSGRREDDPAGSKSMLLHCVMASLLQVVLRGLPALLGLDHLDVKPTTSLAERAFARGGAADDEVAAFVEGAAEKRDVVIARAEAAAANDAEPFSDAAMGFRRSRLPGSGACAVVVDPSSSPALAVTAETWPEVARRVLVAVAQHATGLAEARGRGRGDATECTLGPAFAYNPAQADADLDRGSRSQQPSYSEVGQSLTHAHLHHGPHVLRWFGLSTKAESAAARSAAAHAQLQRPGRGAATLTPRGRALQQQLLQEQAALHADALESALAQANVHGASGPDVACRAIDAFEHARTMQSLRRATDMDVDDAEGEADIRPGVSVAPEACASTSEAEANSNAAAMLRLLLSTAEASSDRVFGPALPLSSASLLTMGAPSTSLPLPVPLSCPSTDPAVHHAGSAAVAAAFAAEAAVDAEVGSGLGPRLLMLGSGAVQEMPWPAGMHALFFGSAAGVRALVSGDVPTQLQGPASAPPPRGRGRPRSKLGREAVVESDDDDVPTVRPPPAASPGTTRHVRGSVLPDATADGDAPLHTIAGLLPPPPPPPPPPPMDEEAASTKESPRPLGRPPGSTEASFASYAAFTTAAAAASATAATVALERARRGQELSGRDAALLPLRPLPPVDAGDHKGEDEGEHRLDAAVEPGWSVKAWLGDLATRFFEASPGRLLVRAQALALRPLGAHLQSPAHADVDAAADADDLDAPPGQCAATGIRESTCACLAAAPPEARVLWRLAALLESEPGFFGLSVARRVRLIRVLVDLATGTPALAEHAERVTEAQDEALASARRLLLVQPPESRAAMLARRGVPMHLVLLAKAEERARVHSPALGIAGFLRLRPTREIRALARRLPSIAAAGASSLLGELDAALAAWAATEGPDASFVVLGRMQLQRLAEGGLVAEPNLDATPPASAEDAEGSTKRPGGRPSKKARAGVEPQLGEAYLAPALSTASSSSTPPSPSSTAVASASLSGPAPDWALPRSSSLDGLVTPALAELDSGAWPCDNSVAALRARAGLCAVTGGTHVTRSGASSLAAAYAPPWTRDEATALLSGLVAVLDARPRLAAPLYSQVFLQVLRSAPIHPARTASDLRDTFEVLRGSAHFPALLREALAALLPAAVERASLAAAAELAAAARQPAINVNIGAGADTAGAAEEKVAPASAAEASSDVDRAVVAARLEARALALLQHWRPSRASVLYSDAEGVGARALEVSRASLDWQRRILHAEVAAGALGGHGLPIGTAFCGRTSSHVSVYAFGALPAVLWVVDGSKWHVVDDATGLDALVASLETEPGAAQLRDALKRRRGLFLAAMEAEAEAQARAVAAACMVAGTGAGADVDASHSGHEREACAFCGFSSTASPAALHCYCCHASFACALPPPGEEFVAGARDATAGAQRDAFAAHVRQCWAKHGAQPVARAIACACARLARASAACGRADIADAVAAAACDSGVAPAALAAAFDPRLLRLKRLLLALSAAADWPRLLRQPSSWPPGARAAWAAAALRARSPAELLRGGFARLEAALRADDAAPRRGAVLRRVVAVHAKTYTSAVEEWAPDPRPAEPSGAWLPPWFYESVPSCAAAVAVPTYAALFLRAHCLAHALLRR